MPKSPENISPIELTDEQWELAKRQHENEEIVLKKGKKKVEEEATNTADTKSEVKLENKKEEDKKEEKKKSEEINFDVAIVDAQEIAKAQARDIASARMTESREDRSGNWFKRTAKRIWKHNLYQEYYLQKEISKVKKELRGEDKLLEGDDSQARAALIERFQNAYDAEMKEDMLKKGETLSPENAALNESMRILIKNHANNPLSEAAFKEERNRILGGYDKSKGAQSAMYADNLYKVAEQIRLAVGHGESLDILAAKVNVRLGNAKEGLNSAAKGSAFDKGMEWLQNSRVGKYFVNEGVVAAAAAIYSTGTFGLQKVVRSKAAQWFTFGGAMALSGALTGFKESARLERERSQHQREMAKGKTFEKGDKRREQFAKSDYERLNVNSVITTLQQSLEALKNDEADPAVIMNTLGQIEARISLGETKKIDLISYSENASIEVEQKNMLAARAKLKIALREKMGLSKEDFKIAVQNKSDNFSKTLLEGDRGVNAQDTQFSEDKWMHIGRKVRNTMLFGAAVGIVGQEGVALVRTGLSSWFGIGHGQDSWLQGAFRNLTGKGGPIQKDATALEAWRRSISGETPRMPMGNEAVFSVGDHNIRLPEGIDLHHNVSDDTYTIIAKGNPTPVIDHLKIKFDSNGKLDFNTAAKLWNHDIYPSNAVNVGEGFHGTPEEYIQAHPQGTHHIEREFHYDNNTHKTDYNEGETRWGGEGTVVSHDHFGHVVGTEGTGIDADGNYVLNINHMTDTGSFHKGFSAHARELMKAGKLKVEFSANKNVQIQPYELSIKPNGDIVIPKDGPIAKLMFAKVHGHAVFEGQYIEPVEPDGINPMTGAERVRVLSTVIGPGKHIVDIGGTPTIRLDLPDVTNYDVPLFVPLVPRKPLETALDREKIIEPKKPADKPKGEKKEGQEKGDNAKAVILEMPKDEQKKYFPVITEKMVVGLPLTATEEAIYKANQAEIVALIPGKLQEVEERKKEEKDSQKGHKVIPVTKAVYDKFVDEGFVPYGALLGIAEKVKAGTTLTNEEQAIYADSKNAAKIESILQKTKKNEKGKPDSNVVELGKFDDSADFFQQIAKKIVNGEKPTAAEKVMYAEHEDEINVLARALLEKKGTTAPTNATVTVTKEMYDNFLKTNNVPEEVITSMAHKIKAGGMGALTGEERHIYYKKASDVEDVLIALRKAEEAVNPKPKSKAPDNKTPDTTKKASTSAIEQLVLRSVVRKIKDVGLDSLTVEEKEFYDENQDTIEDLLKEKEPQQEKLIPLTMEAYQAFLDNGTVERGVLLSIAQKVREKGGVGALTREEREIYRDKDYIIEAILNEKDRLDKAVGTTEKPVPVEEKILPVTKEVMDAFNSVVGVEDKKSHGPVERGVLLGIAQKVRDGGLKSLTKDERAIYNDKNFIVKAILNEKGRLEKVAPLPPENLPIGKTPEQMEQENFTQDQEKIKALLGGGKNISSLKREDLASEKGKELYDTVKASKEKGNKLKLLAEQFEKTAEEPKKKVNDELVWEKYFTSADTISDPEFIESEKRRTHSEDGGLNSTAQHEVDQINRFISEGREPLLENAVAEILKQIQEVMKALKLKPSQYISSKTAAYRAIIERFDQDGGLLTNDPLEWDENLDSLSELQNIVDQMVGEELAYESTSKQKVSKKLPKATPAELRELLSKPGINLGNKDLEDLGRLVRENLGIADIAGEVAPMPEDISDVPENNSEPKTFEKSENFKKNEALIRDRYEKREYVIPGTDTGVMVNKKGAIIKSGSTSVSSDDWVNDKELPKADKEKVKKLYLEDKENVKVLESPVTNKALELATVLGGEVQLRNLIGNNQNYYNKVGNYMDLGGNGSILDWLIESKKELPTIEKLLDEELAKIKNPTT